MGISEEKGEKNKVIIYFRVWDTERSTQAVSLRSECSSTFLQEFPKAQINKNIHFPLSTRPPKLPHVSYLFETFPFLLSFCLILLYKHFFPLSGSESAEVRIRGTQALFYFTPEQIVATFFSIPPHLSLSPLLSLSFSPSRLIQTSTPNIWIERESRETLKLTCEARSVLPSAGG